jgi:hypothetical protein
LIYNCISFISVSRTKKNHNNYDTDPYLWESDQSPINFTFADFTKSTSLRGDAGVSSGFQGYHAEPALGGGWLVPKPETGNEMFISFYTPKVRKCPLYCEKSGIYVTIILILNQSLQYSKHSNNPLGGSWIYPKPETGNEMFISFWGTKVKECPLYCEKSGSFVTIILITKVYNIP